eukprot:UC4_evm1s226
MQPWDSSSWVLSVCDAINSGNFQAVCIQGTSPPRESGGETDLLEIVGKSKIGSSAGSQMLMMLDGYKGIENVMRTGAIDILKINIHELRHLSNLEPSASPLRCATKIFSMTTLKTIAVTNGPSEAYFFPRTPELSMPYRYYEYKLPALNPNTVLNATGAGDATGAAFVTMAMQGFPAPVAFAWGLAGGCAS